MKATILITEKPSGKCDMEVSFDPPLKRQDLPKSNVGRVVLAFVEFMKSNAESMEATSVTTTPK